MTTGWLELILWGVTAFFLLQTIAACVHLRWAQRLPPLTSPLISSPRLVSVVLAARDEGTRIEATIRRLLAQQGVPMEIVAVDDRSVDDTGAILRRLADEDPRLTPVRVDVLPEGWLGKCHACHLGAATATGDWLLFTDGDCWLPPDVVVRALAIAERDGVDHVTMTPGIASASVGARAWHLAFLISLVNWLSGVNRDRPKAYLGMGAFNLVRSTAYRACGGYEALRLTVLDDVKLGLLLRRAGSRTRAFLGGSDAECRWGISILDMIAVMEKNYFAAIEYRTSIAVAIAIGMPILFGAVVLGPFTGTVAGVGPGLGLMSIALPAAILASRLHWPRRTALLTPFILPILFYAMLNSAAVTLRRGGIRWRGTFYPLDVLRRGSVR